MQVVPLELWHLDQIDAQGAQDYISRWITPEIQNSLAAGLAFAAVEGDEILACAGVIQVWEGRGIIWAVLSGNIGRRFIAVHRASLRFLDMCFVRRIEAIVDTSFAPGVRWVEMLGFRLETECMRGYLPTGGDAAMYVRGV
jgi:hypothetical protein